MSHSLNLLQELLQILFLALGSAWFAIDLARKLRAPQTGEEPRSIPAPAPTPTPAAVTAPVAAPASAPLAVAAQPAPTAPAAEASLAGIPATHFAAITAAVHHLFKGRVRLASVLPVAASASASATHADWAREGRRDIFISHRVR